MWYLYLSLLLGQNEKLHKWSTLPDKMQKISSIINALSILVKVVLDRLFSVFANIDNSP